MESIGNNAKSIDIPAIPPATAETKRLILIQVL